MIKIKEHQAHLREKISKLVSEFAQLEFEDKNFEPGKTSIPVQGKF